MHWSLTGQLTFVLLLTYSLVGALKNRFNTLRPEFIQIGFESVVQIVKSNKRLDSI